MAIARRLAQNIDWECCKRWTALRKLNVTGTATLAGTLGVALVNGFVPPLESVFTFMTYTSRSGDFSTLIGADIGNGTQFVLDSASATSSKLSVVTG